MCKISVSSEKPVLEIRDASYCYEGDSRPVWEHLSCSFYRGKIHALCGPSGCGKSSVLSLLDGLIPHLYEGMLSGSVFLYGEDITGLLPRERCKRIGYVMQNPESQFCTFTVEEELAFGMENLGISPTEMEERIREALSFVGMEGFEARDLNQLSGGQKQKIAIASVLVMNPDILLLDEPSANLDPQSRKQIFDLITRLSGERQMTVILVEHNIREMLLAVDRILLFDADGTLLAEGERETVLSGNREKLHLTEAGRDSVAFCHSKLPQESRSEGIPVLKIQDLSFAYPAAGRKKGKAQESGALLRRVSFALYPQDFLAILGKNGVGKSTLLRLIFRICTPDSGSVELFGRPVSSYPKNRLYQEIGLVFQNPESQFIKNTVYEDMLFSLKKSALSKEEKKARVLEMLRRFRLEEEKEKSPFVLSQGQKRRLSVAEMLLTNQKILFLDEPTYGQDFENRQELMREMEALRQSGITIVMITHDLELVKAYANRVIELASGTVKKDLPAETYFASLCTETEEC